MPDGRAGDLSQRRDPGQPYALEMPTAIGDSADPVVSFIRTWLPRLGPFNEVLEPVGHLPLLRAAAQRRGLDVVEHAGATVFLLDGRAVGGCKGTGTSLNGEVGVSLGRAKDASKLLFQRCGVPTPTWRIFAPDQFDDAQAWVKGLRFPVVVKPNDLAGGLGVTTGVLDLQDLRRAWAEARTAGPRSKILIERYVAGLDVRAYVVDGRMVGAVTRLPAHVVGDGRATLDKLVQVRAARRSRHDHLKRLPLVVDMDYLRRMGLSLDSVPAPGQIVIISGVANVKAGGETAEITRLVHPRIAETAVQAARALPGLRSTGVDVLVTALDEPDGGTVLEVNSHANITMHAAPAFGPATDVAGAIVDAMLMTDTARSNSRASGAQAVLRRGTRRARRKFS